MLKKSHQFFFFLLILFLPSQLGFHFWPSWAYILGRKVDYLSPTLFFTDILLVSTIIFWLISLVKEKRLTLGNIKRDTVFILVCCVLFIGINIYTAVNIWASFLGWVKFLEFALLGIYILRTRPSFFKTTIFLASGALFSVCLALGQVIKGGSVGSLFWIIGERSFTLATPDIAKAVLCLPGSLSCQDLLRPYATFPHPNVLAGFLGITVLFILFMRMKSRQRHHEDYKNAQTFSRIAVMVCVFGIVLTFSRSSWVGLIFSLMIMFPQRRKFIVGGIMFLVLAIFLYTPLSSIVTSESFVVRSQLTEATVRMLIQHPWFGVGANNFLLALPSFLPERTIYFLQPVHNIFLLLLSQIGILGSTAMVLIGIYIAKQRHCSPIPYLLFPPLFFLLIIGLFDHYLLTLQQGQLLMTIVISFSLISV